MKHLLDFLYFLYLFNQSHAFNEEILLLNDKTNISYPPYSILPSTNRVKRDKSTWFYPEINH